MVHDVVIRGGLIVDGIGGSPFAGDVCIDDGRISAVGTADGAGSTEIDASGLVVTPGFIDVHTHLDAQLWWEPHGTPSIWHGVTSVVFGNCGVTFAPCHASDRSYLAQIMQSVEDIPADAVMAGLPWTWEMYGEFLENMAGRPLGLNAGGLVGHCAVRYFAMGEASMEDVPAPADALAEMESCIEEALDGGALGFSTSRTKLHRAPGGRYVPGTFAPMEELFALSRVLERRGKGVFGAVTDLLDEDGSTVDVTLGEVRDLGRISMESGRPVTFGIAQSRQAPDFFRQVLDVVHEMRDRGADLRPQTTTRAIGIVYTLASRTPFDKQPSWRALRGLPLEQKLEQLRDRHVRERMIGEATAAPDPVNLEEVSVLPPGEARYDLGVDDSLAGHARQRGAPAAEVFLDLCLETEGTQVFTWARFNPSLDAVQEMIEDDTTLLGLADAGAHVGMIMDASQPTHLLSYWSRDRGVLTLAEAVRRLTSDPATVFDLRDRGVLRTGAHADLNVLDLENLRLEQPRYVHDMPEGAGRLIQRAGGYRYTFVNGEVVAANGECTANMPGVVFRGA
jgi:N-acyl-D-amino-acid deacylase